MISFDTTLDPRASPDPFLDIAQGQHHASSFAPDPRFSTQQSQQQYSAYSSRGAPMTDPNDARILPPLTSQQHHGYQGMPSNQIRSPTAGYPTSYAPFPGHQPAGTDSYPTAPDPRTLPPPVNPLQYDSISGAALPRRSSMSVDRTVPSRVSGHAPTPYARGPSSVVYSSPEEPPTEPMIKKKRKRADAEQLKVLNETYARTAFPSTEQRISLAKELGMSARSVQIW